MMGSYTEVIQSENCIQYYSLKSEIWLNIIPFYSPCGCEFVFSNCIQ